MPRVIFKFVATRAGFLDGDQPHRGAPPMSMAAETTGRSCRRHGTGPWRPGDRLTGHGLRQRGRCGHDLGGRPLSMPRRNPTGFGTRRHVAQTFRPGPGQQVAVVVAIAGLSFGLVGPPAASAWRRCFRKRSSKLVSFGDGDAVIDDVGSTETSFSITTLRPRGPIVTFHRIGKAFTPNAPEKARDAIEN